MISFRIYVLLTMLILKTLLVNEGSFILVVIEFFPHENSRQKLRLNILVSMISSRMNGQVTKFLNSKYFIPHTYSCHKIEAKDSGCQ